jgi:hypothetical protein
MSMSTHVEAFKPPNEKWLRMKAVWDACDDAGIEQPGEVETYFGGMPPDPAGVEVPRGDLFTSGAVRDWKYDHVSEGYEIDVAKLPADVTIVRVYNSY